MSETGADLAADLAADLVAAAGARGLMIASAESCTGGMVSAAITAVPGSSAVFSGGYVSYANAAKMAMLGVSAQSLSAHGAVSEPVAAEMASGARLRTKADLAVAITGIAGPGGSDHKPEGRVCFALASAGQTTTQTVEFGALGRAAVRQAACAHALALLHAALA